MAETLRAAIYCRVSTSRQEEDGTSLETQEDRCRAHAAEHGYQVTGVWRDSFTGAKYRERPALSALREQVRAGAVDVVLAYALDRLSRKDAHVAIIADEAEEHGARLEFVTERFEDTAVGRFIRSAKAFAAEIEREKIGERTNRAKMKRAESGRLLPGCRPLYGYVWRDETRSAYAENPETASVVRRIFREALAGYTLRGIARRLNDDGIPTPRGGSVWSPTVVHGILRHPSYAGEAAAWAWRANGESKTIRFDAENAIALPEGTIPPLVDRATWEAVQRRLARNKATATRNARNPESALLRGGYVVCGYCGRNMRVVPHKTRAEAYQCVNAQSLAHPCRSHSITVRELDRVVWERVRSVLLDPAVVAGELARMRAADSTEADLRPIDTQLADVKRRQTNLARQISDTDDADVADVLRAELGTLAKRRRDLEAERGAVAAQRARWEEAQERLDDITRWCGKVAANIPHLTYADKRLALDWLGVRAQVWGAGHAPRWNIQASIPIGGDVVSLIPRRC